MAFNPFKFVAGIVITAVGFHTRVPWLQQLGISVARAGLFGPALADSVNTFQAQSVDPQNAIPVVYGTAKVGVKIVGLPTNRIGGGPPNESLWIIGAVCHGSQNGDGIEEFHELWLDGILAVQDGGADLSGGGWLVSSSPPIEPFFKPSVLPNGAFEYARYRGSMSQSVSAPLNHHFSIEWPSTSRLAGIAYVVCRVESDEDIFRSMPEVTLLVSGAKVYDPRTSSWAWSDNPALCILDHLTSPVYGRGLPLSKIDLASFNASADYCDQLVADPDGNRKRYTCNGALDTQLPLEARLGHLLSSCNGFLVKQEDVYRLHIRGQQAATGITITEADIVGSTFWHQHGTKQSGNAAMCAFVDPDEEYQVNVVQWPDPGSALETQFLVEDDLDVAEIAVELPFTNNKYMAQRIGADRIREGRYADELVLTLREEFIELEVGDIVTVDVAFLGSDAPMDCWVTHLIIGEGDEGRTLVQVGLLQYLAGNYAAPTLGGVPNPPTISPPDPTAVGDPTGLNVTAALGAPGEIVLTLTWTAPSTGSVKAYEVQWGAGATPATWVPVPDVPGGLASTTIRIQNPTDTIYTVRIRTRTFYGTVGNWVSDSVTLGATSTPQKQGYHNHGDQSGAYDIDWTLGTIHRVRMTGNLSPTFSGYAAGMAILLIVVDDGSGYTFTPPACHYSPNGAVPAGPGAGAEDQYGFSAEGTTLASVNGHKVGQGYS